MEKTYILLRSNKQQGPFSLAQLAKMDLKPEDLVNVQGGIAGWQYAHEIDVLKPYLLNYLAPSVPVGSTASISAADAPSLPVVTTSSAPIVGTPSVPVANTPSAPVANTSSSPAVPKEKKPETSAADLAQPTEPKIQKVEPSVPATAGVFASFPAGTELSASGRELKSAASSSSGNPIAPSGLKPVETSSPVVVVTPSKPAEIATKPSVIKPAATSSQRAAVTESIPNASATKPMVIKPVAPASTEPASTALVAESVPRKQQARTTATLRKSLPVARTRRKMKPAVVASSVLALGILAFAVGQFATRSDKNVSSPVERSSTNLATNTTSSTTVVPDNRTVLQQELPLATDEQNITPIAVNETSPAKPSLQEDKTGSQKQVIASTPDSQQEALNNLGKANITEPVKPIAKEPVKAGADLTEQIYLKSNFINNELGEGVFDLNISIDNKSDKVLKTVAVNIFYTDTDGKTLNKQTVYFSNVKPGETIARPASPHKLATRVRCQLGLVSSEGLLYYAN